ncbi:hypothetical protein DPMN_180641 [Dreissena polymorpha]|uniref:Uncharacterized protein n=1 Tax=Dreissena polymorpha TaxID=45954 RepID=A0A9D4EJI7_DREPO|nr:hypothetical protein DPMN_180641 [Dreissena polymorpha]
MSSLGRWRRVALHDVVVHDGGAPKEAETSWAAQYAAENVLGRLLKPMTHRIFELLVPNHRPCNVTTDEQNINTCP